MTVTTVPMTLTLSIIIGAYLVAGGFSGLTDRDRWKTALEEFKTRPGLTYIAGIVAFAIGAAIVTSHNNWADPLAIFITLIGWAAVLEGLVIVAAPKPLLEWAGSVVETDITKKIAIGALAIGTILFLLGVLGRAG